MSLRLQEAVSLKPFNTFGVDVNARLFAEARNDHEVREALAEAAHRGLPLMPIGGGRNLLRTAGTAVHGHRAHQQPQRPDRAAVGVYAVGSGHHLFLTRTAESPYGLSQRNIRRTLPALLR